MIKAKCKVVLIEFYFITIITILGFEIKKEFLIYSNQSIDLFYQ
jgi:hypothetical protein